MICYAVKFGRPHVHNVYLRYDYNFVAMFVVTDDA